MRHLAPTIYRKCLWGMATYLALYGVLIALFPGAILAVLPALYISFVLCGIITLSQHSHIAMMQSNGEEVRPLKFKEQARYSRSLLLPHAVGKYLLFNFNLHEAHHTFPGLPCYRLETVTATSANAFEFFPWLKRVKSLRGVDFIFRTDTNGIRF